MNVYSECPFGDPAMMSLSEVNAALCAIKREKLERKIERVMSSGRGMPWREVRAVESALAMLDADDVDYDLEDDADDEDGADWELVNEDGGDILDEPHDDEGEDDDADLEPSLGWPEVPL